MLRTVLVPLVSQQVLRLAWRDQLGMHRHVTGITDQDTLQARW